MRCTNKENVTIVFGGDSDIASCLINKVKNIVLVSKKDADVRKYKEVLGAVSKYKPTNIVNCAGVCNDQTIIDSNMALWKQEIEVNLIGSYNVAKASVVCGVDKTIFVSSASGLMGRAGQSGYCASKAGVISIAMSLHLEGYNSYCISPYRVSSKMDDARIKRGSVGRVTQNTLSKKDVASVIIGCINGEYLSGDNIVVGKKEGLGSLSIRRRNECFND